MTSVLAGVPVKSFAAAKKRLAAAVPPELRVALSQEMARRTCLLLARAGARPLIVAADTEVAAWASEHSLEASLEEGSDLNRAADATVSMASGQPWLVIHADLPLLDEDVLSPVIATIARGDSTISSSRDGGTPVLGGSMAKLDFSYGPSSYHRHLRILAPTHPTVVVDPRLAIDLDDPGDLEVVRRRVRWIREILDTLESS